MTANALDLERRACVRVGAERQQRRGGALGAVRRWVHVRVVCFKNKLTVVRWVHFWAVRVGLAGGRVAVSLANS